MSLDLDQFHATFFEEAYEALDSMEAALLRLNLGSPDAETINTIFRVAHSIKGGAGMFGFTDITSFTHTLETLLDELRAGRMQVTLQISEGLLQSVDVLRAMMSATQKQQPCDTTTSNELQVLFKDLVEHGDVAVAPPVALSAVETAADDPEDLEALFDAVAAQTSQAAAAAPAVVRWRIQFKALPELLSRGNDPLRMLEDLAALGDLTVKADLGRLPSFDQMDPGVCYLAWDLELATAKPRESIDQIFEWAEGDCELAIESLTPAAAAPPAPAEAPPAPPAAAAAEAAQATATVPAPAAAAARPVAAAAPAGDAPRAGISDSNSIRVAIEKIDELLNTVGEIVITQSMLSQLAARFEGVHADRMRSGLAQLEGNIRELQESVMRVRMLPVGSVFSRFPRLVRDLSTRLGKQIRLQITGEQTELDKTVLEKIGDPLVHLVRNSIDHGIEMPDARVASGKPAEGTVHLNAFHKGGAITLEVSDDGKGLDKHRLLEKAISKGLVEPNAQLTDEQIHDLIFLPGFSTAAQTTDLSGRGVGMDVVRRNIKELGGSIELRTEPGKGTRFQITLPLTLAIVDGQSVAVGEETYIVPLVTIIESLQLKQGAASQLVGHGEVFTFRGDYLPVIRLHEVFGVEAKRSQLHEGLIMVVEGDGRRAGLFIDDLLGQQQVVIKSMETNYARIDGVGGATILGEGTVALILDVPGLIRLAAERQLRQVA
jgi:two-component system chemotaxis sensor kinase CheA